MYNLKKWDMIKESLKDSFSANMYEMLFNDMLPVYMTNEEIVLEVNEMSYSFLQDKDTMNYKKLKYVLCAYTNVDVSIRIVHKDEDITKSRDENTSGNNLLDKIPSDLFKNEITPQQEVVISPRKLINHSNSKETNLKDNMTFDNFFYSFENKKVIKACSVIVETNNNPRFNPLFIYGHSGIGKTHLVNAIGNEILRKNDNKKVLYVTATKFLEEYTNLFKGGINNLDATDFFKEKYYSVDVLIFDDIQILEGKESTLTEFFSIFEQLMFAEKMIIITSDKHPQEIMFEERLISRFLSGLTLELRVPDSDTKKQIFNHHAVKEDFKVTEKAMEIFITNSQNVRALLGYIGAMVLFSINGDVENGEFDEQHAQEIVNNQSVNVPISKEEIIDIVLKYFELSHAELQAKTRKERNVKARQFIAYFLYNKNKMNYSEIARVIYVKEHSTALRAVKKIEKEKNYLKYKEDYLKLSKMINK